MTNRLEAFTTRKYTTQDGEEKTAWTRVGVAFQHKNGGGWNVSLDSIPAPTIKDGKASFDVVLMPPKEREDAPRQGGGGNYAARRNPPAQTAPDMDSDIPF